MRVMTEGRDWEDFDEQVAGERFNASYFSLVNLNHDGERLTRFQPQDTDGRNGGFCSLYCVSNITTDSIM